MSPLDQRPARPGPVFGSYPERRDRQRQGPRAAGGLLRRTGAGGAGRLRFVASVHRALAQAPAWGAPDFAAGLALLRAEMGRLGLAEPLIARAFALVSQASLAVLGVRPYDVQVVAARIMLDHRLAEMAMGEGKSLATLLAAATAALAGIPVHVATANAYLAARDAERFGPLFASLGLSCTAVDAADEPDQRRRRWQHAVVYCTASDLLFDYLRDATAPEGDRPLMRGLCMALVDEADSVLIDEAQMPFVLAREQPDPAARCRLEAAMGLARQLREGEHFQTDPVSQRMRLLAAGRSSCTAALAGAPWPQDPLWEHRLYREDLVERALTALHCFHREVHYLVQWNARRCADEVVIIDPTTGRVAEGRRWSGWMHQLVEIKEGLPPSPQQTTQAQLTFQSFLPRYWHLAGTSGTLREVSRELRQVYGLATEAVPTRLPSRRRHHGLRVFIDSESRWQAAVEVVGCCIAAGRPVLIGVDSVAQARQLSQRLQAAGLAHQCLDARQDADEAARVARAGQAGCVTVATNMAGRGTDIPLGPGVAERGGLHVLACQHNPSARIDRQLTGRAARAGEPGSVQALLALDEGLFASRLPRGLRTLLGGWARLRPGRATLPVWLGLALHRVVQGLEEQAARQRRRELIRADRRLQRGLGLTNASR